MSLPGILEPSGLPAFLLAGHAIDPEDIYSTHPRGTGHRRKRRIFTNAPLRAAVSRILSPAQMVAYDDWFENTIVVGETHFSALVANLGAGQVWFDACWIAPYQSTPFATPKGIYWRLEGELLLSGEPSTERPVDGALAVEYSASLTGSASIQAPFHLVVEYSAHLSSAMLLEVEYTAQLQIATPSFRLREGSDFRLREGGGKRMRQSNG